MRRCFVVARADSDARPGTSQPDADMDAKIKAVKALLVQEHVQHNHGRTLVFGCTGNGKRASVGWEREHVGSLGKSSSWYWEPYASMSSMDVVK